MSISPGQRASRRQENRLALLMQGVVTPGSGNQWFAKGDVSTEHELIEAKITAFDSFTLKLKELRKIRGEAVMEGKRPVFFITFASSTHADYVVLEDSDYQELRRRAGEIQ